MTIYIHRSFLKSVILGIHQRKAPEGSMFCWIKGEAGVEGHSMPAKTDFHCKSRGTEWPSDFRDRVAARRF
jgi:hypothetical protein